MDAFSEFDYLCEPARKYGNFYVVDEILKFVANASREQLADLRRAYEEIDKRNDAYRLSRWIDRAMFPEEGVSYKERRFAQQVGQLLGLFKWFAEKGVSPFSSSAVNYIERFKKPNWENVPEELRYLVPLAEEYGVHRSELDMIDFLESAREGELDQLSAAAEKCRLNSHFSLLNDWLDRHPITEHEEAARLYFLFGVMDHAGLDFGG
jgi:hypothetical protein